jgi:hypothetical protein
MGRRSAAARRERKRAREEAAKFDKLTVQQRLAVALAKTATLAEISNAIANLLHIAKQDNRPGSAVSAMRVFAQLATLALEDPDPGEEDWSKMTPEQIAQRRAVVARLIEQLEAEQVHPSDPANPDNVKTTS